MVGIVVWISLTSFQRQLKNRDFICFIHYSTLSDQHIEVFAWYMICSVNEWMNEARKRELQYHTMSSTIFFSISCQWHIFSPSTEANILQFRIHTTRNKGLLSQPLLHLESVPLIAPWNINFFVLLLNYSLGPPKSFQDAKKQLYFSTFCWYSMFYLSQPALTEPVYVLLLIWCFRSGYLSFDSFPLVVPFDNNNSRNM